MNSTKKNSEFGGVKKKLTAAIAMLLVATIMMVSSTYAWFTLSTAPEVTGITTSVGANGNLEMALLTKDTYNHTDAITSAVGDSSSAANKTAVTANITWGNLVDLSDASYGLNNIKLLPSRLLAKNGTIANLTAAIAVADYGNDGRVTTLNEGTVSGIYQVKSETDATKIFKVSTDEYGVRALGTASGMSQQQLAYRNAQGYMATYTAQAKTYAQQSLNLYGSQLANIAVQHATASGETDATTYTKADAEAINGMLDQLTLSKNALEKALMYTVLAKVASKVGSADKYAAVKAAVEAENATLASVETAATTAFVPSDTDGYAGAKTAWNAMTIPEKIDTKNKDSFTWSDMQAAVNGLMDTSELKLNGVAVSEIKKNIQKIVDDVLGGKGLTLTMDSDSGIYDYVAQACGNFSANVTIKEISYNGISAKNVKATMTTGSNVTPAYMVKALTYAVAYGAPEQAAGEVQAITDTYAYAIDLAFRTNAANANLQLQTEAAQRIYDGSTVQDTQGAGSNFTFTLGANFTAEAAKKLAGCIYVVFVDNTGSVVGTAGLDTSNEGWSVSGTEYKANLIMKNVSFDTDGKITDNGNAATSTITALTQNQAKVLTAYVYLNGDKVDNSMVAANGAVSMVGSLNLQFSTDQTLTPMDYTPLQQSGSTGTKGQDGN